MHDVFTTWSTERLKRRLRFVAKRLVHWGQTDSRGVPYRLRMYREQADAIRTVLDQRNARSE